MVHRRPRDHGRGLRHRADLHHQHRARSPAHPREFGRARGDRLDPEAGQDPAARGAAPRASATTSSASSRSAPGRCRTGSTSTTGRTSLERRRRRRPRSRAQVAGVGRDDLACIIYTSGTGGAPRGVLQHHGAILHNRRRLRPTSSRGFRLGRRGVPVLPAAQPRLRAYRRPACSRSGSARRSITPRASRSSPPTSRRCSPTIMVVVPRLFEVLRTRIIEADREAGRPLQLPAATARSRSAATGTTARCKPWRPADGRPPVS